MSGSHLRMQLRTLARMTFRGNWKWVRRQFEVWAYSFTHKNCFQCGKPKHDATSRNCASCVLRNLARFLYEDDETAVSQ